MDYQTIKVRFQESVCFIEINRPKANNAINHLLVQECDHVLARCDETVTVVVLEGSPEVFCFGADFQDLEQSTMSGELSERGPEPLYDLWMKLATGSYITVSHVRGKANAGGVGFVAASDIVLADETALFSLSELLFGLIPACVMPFLIRRIGFQQANYMTLMTQPVAVQQAYSWGLVNAYDKNSDSLLRKHLLRLKRLSKKSIIRYKRFMRNLQPIISQAKPLALEVNHEVFADKQNIEGICRFVQTGQFPWES